MKGKHSKLWMFTGMSEVEYALIGKEKLSKECERNKLFTVI